MTSEGRRRRRRNRKFRRRGGGGGVNDVADSEGWATSADEGWANEENWQAAGENWDSQSMPGRPPKEEHGGRRGGRGRGGHSDGPPSREGTYPRRRPPPVRQSPGRRPPQQPRKPTVPAVNGN